MNLYLCRNIATALFALSIGFMSGCTEDDNETDLLPQQDTTPFTIREISGSIVTELEPDLLSSIHQDLIDKNRKEDASKLTESYSLESGKMLKKTVEKLKISENSIINGKAEVWDENIFKYKAYVNKQGWQSWRAPGEIAGTTGQRVAVLEFILSTDPFQPPLERPALRYRAHVAHLGWEQWNTWDGVGGQGNTGHVEAIQMYSTTPGYNVWYQAHVTSKGWLSWVSNGTTAGTTNEHRGLEAFKARIYQY
jgi:uncharacterized protein YjdB